MIGYRHCDSRWPFYWVTSDQPAGRWHATGQGPVQYLADTPTGAWAEFLRHEEITDPDDLATIQRAMWSIEFDEELAATALSSSMVRGDESTYPACRQETARLRESGSGGLRAPSAALLPGQASGYRAGKFLKSGPHREGEVYVLFGPRPRDVGWQIVADGRPPGDVLPRVRHL